MSDRIAVLSDGHIEQIGTPSISIASRTLRRRIHRSVQSSRRIGQGTQVYRRLAIREGISLLARVTDESKARPGDAIVAVVRPDDVVIPGDAGSAGGGSPFSGTITVISSIWARTHKVRIHVCQGWPR